MLFVSAEVLMFYAIHLRTRMIAAVNSSLPEAQRFELFIWSPTKAQRLAREYWRQFPEGRLLVRRRLIVAAALLLLMLSAAVVFWL